MKKTELFNKMSRSFHRAGLIAKKHSPEVLVGVGIVGVVGATVLACKATTKLDTILDEAKDNIEKIHNAVEHPETLPEEYTEEDSKKDLTIVYAQTGLKVAKLYAPAVTVGVVSITAIISGHRILSKRNAALAAAYAVVDKSFKEYRGRVVERFGKDLDRELRYNIKAKEFEETVVNEDGTETVVTNTVDVIETPEYSEYAVFFCEGCRDWTKDPEANKKFLLMRQNYANEILKHKGHLFLNEVYDMLDIPRTKAGQVVGWIYDEKCPNGDNIVDFGIFNTYEANKRFVNGYERSILLDFNVDGPILDLI